MFLKTGLLMTSIFALTAGAQDLGGHVIPTPAEKLFVPLGFDDNDTSEVVVHGHYTSSCFRPESATVRVNNDTKEIHISAFSTEGPATTCADVMLPFAQTVELGTLEAGNYEVFLDNAPNIEPQVLKVALRHTESADDFNYAPVEDAVIDVTNPSDEQTLTVSGRYPLTLVGCAIMREVRVTRAPGDVILVQPILDLLTDNAECLARDWKPTFVTKVTLDEPIREKAAYLIHVRVSGGESFNKVQEVAPQ